MPGQTGGKGIKQEHIWHLLPAEGDVGTRREGEAKRTINTDGIIKEMERYRILRDCEQRGFAEALDELFPEGKRNLYGIAEDAG